MRKKEILAEIAVLKRQNEEYYKIIKTLDKRAKKNLYWWWLFPFFGFIIYSFMVQKRKQTTQYQKDSILVKTELAKNEFAILKLEKELEKIHSIFRKEQNLNE